MMSTALNQNQHGQNVSSNCSSQTNNMMLAILNNELENSFATINHQHELIERQQTREFIQQLMMMNR